MSILTQYYVIQSSLIIFTDFFLFLCEHNPCESRVWFSFGFSSLAFSHHHGDFLHHPFSMVFICLTLGQVLLLLGILHLVKNSSTVSTWSPKRIVNRYCSCNFEVPKPLFLLLQVCLYSEMKSQGCLKFTYSWGKMGFNKPLFHGVKLP